LQTVQDMRDNSTLVYKRLLGYWYDLPDDIRDEAAHFYFREHEWCVDIARIFDLPLDIVTAVVAALSPASWWEQNKKDAIAVLLHGSDATVATYPANKYKALRILEHGNIAAELHRPTTYKTWNFYHNLLTPDNPFFVTNDRHQVDAFGLQLRHKKIPNPVYREMTDFTIEAAAMVRHRRRKVIPSAFQSVVWHGVKYMKGQLI
jgi:hypothetical protein